MTDEQRYLIEVFRGIIKLTKKGEPVPIDIAGANTLLGIFDAQEAELQAARDTIARCVALLSNAYKIDLVGGRTLYRDFPDGWYNSITKGKGGCHASPLDAYDALKEVAP